MKAVLANNAGVLKVLGDNSDYNFFDINSGEKIIKRDGEYLFSIINDWTYLTSNNYNLILDKATSVYWTKKIASYIKEIIKGIKDQDLEREVLNYIEEIIESNKVSHENIIDDLLIAPISDQIIVENTVSKVLSLGHTNIGSILDSVIELQPQIKRLTEIWLYIDKTEAANLPFTEYDLWQFLIDNLEFSKLLKSESKESFIKTWDKVLFLFQNAQSRIGMNRIGNKLADKLYPHELEQQKDIQSLNEHEFIRTSGLTPEISNQEAYERVQKQINSIVEKVKEGSDRKAKKFLRELISMQLEFPEGRTLVLKSLCHIAKRCADLFRNDFELFALNKALNMPQTDRWTLIQYGDHLKRAGKYNEALGILDRKVLQNEPVAKSLRADIYAEKGEYTRAMEIYKSITSPEQKPIVDTALADIYRKMGDYDRAEKLYQAIINKAKRGDSDYLGDSETRAKVGLAEVEKQRGRIDRSKGIYEEIIGQNLGSNIDKLYYKLGYCNVLKLNEEYQKAYEVVDQIIQNHPFAMEAKFIRASILGLISKEEEGLADLKGGISEWKKWLRNYYKGLLLLKLSRFEEARKNLVENIPALIDSDEERYILKLGSIIWFITNNDYSEANIYFENLPSTTNRHFEYLTLVLKLHLATKLKDEETKEQILQKLDKKKIIDKSLEKAITALNSENYDDAIQYEANALLKLAA